MKNNINLPSLYASLKSSQNHRFCPSLGERKKSSLVISSSLVWTNCSMSVIPLQYKTFLFAVFCEAESSRRVPAWTQDGAFVKDIATRYRIGIRTFRLLTLRSAN